MSESNFSLTKTISDVRKTESSGTLFDVLQKIFGISGDLERVFQDFEELERVKEIYTDNEASILELFEARSRRIAVSDIAHTEFFRVPENRALMRREEGISNDGIKNELIGMGSSLASVNKHEVEEYGHLVLAEQNYRKLLKEKNSAQAKWYSTMLQSKLESTSELLLVNKTIERLWSEINQDIRNVSSMDEEKQSALRLEIGELYNEQKQLIDTIIKHVKDESDALFDMEINAAQDAYTQTVQKKIEHESALFFDITTELLERSGISEEQAAVWAEKNVFIAGNAVNKLRRIGYNPEQLKKDVAELYRYVGGKLGPIEFVLEGRSTRAYTRGTTTISIQGNFNKTTLFHECGHLIEHWDSAFWLACSDFIARRATGAPAKLKTLTKLRYPQHEKAYPDNFISPYVGKIYNAGSTEVVSMGLQCLSNSQSLALLARNDPDHFKLVLGVCIRNNPFLKKKIDEAEGAAAGKSKELTLLHVWQKALAKVSSTVFGKLLDASNGGYKGFKIEAHGRSGALFPVTPPAGELWNTSIHFGKLAELRAVAYLLIAHQEGLLFQGMTSIEAQRQAILLIRQGKVPEWFLPENPLPKV